jgi:hypothetical protein
MKYRIISDKELRRSEWGIGEYEVTIFYKVQASYWGLFWCTLKTFSSLKLAESFYNALNSYPSIKTGVIHSK